ncbi:LD-carboxypeptidase [Nocardioides gansuensis]|uniref:LD-carboxypeptidase n=1 Tax=Nocardioides gansuensis TaxID=2138300 RepID=A0A2T8F6X3_9ACTN|nr:S66 peptidase family protein [Nocardioides gansuensis]PVG81417.1 LD-carboxypeptidase [Nocardioides gansuensis]
MSIRVPRPLRPGDRIGVTSPSSGVGGEAAARIDFCVDWLSRHGYDVVVGACMDGTRHVSAPKEQRAAELTAMLTDPDVRAVVPPWGGETGIDLIDLLDYDAIAAAEPTWLVGYSDSSTYMLPLLLRAGLATIHGDNLADTPYVVPDGLVHWLDVAHALGPVTQRDSGLVADWVPFEEDSRATSWKRVGTGVWSVLGGGSAAASGILVGGCLDTVASLAGTPYGDVPAFAAEHGDLLVFLEACEYGAFDVCRMLHGLRLAGRFDSAAAVLIGRTAAPDAAGFTQRDAVADALGSLDVPVVLDLEIGHVPPHLPLVLGARAEVVVDGDRREITQWIQPQGVEQ